MPTYDKQNPLTFPVRVFTSLVIAHDADGNVVHVPGTVRPDGTIDSAGHGYAEYQRSASEPCPRTADEAVALLRSKVAKVAALRALVDQDRPGLTPGGKALAIMRDVVASGKAPAALAAKVLDGKAVRLVDGVTVDAAALVVEVAPVDGKPIDAAPDVSAGGGKVLDTPVEPTK